MRFAPRPSGGQGQAEEERPRAHALLAEDDPECAKPVKEFATSSTSSFPFGLDVGPDGNLWFTESGVNRVARPDDDRR